MGTEFWIIFIGWFVIAAGLAATSYVLHKRESN
jgi:hypothetical protein